MQDIKTPSLFLKMLEKTCLETELACPCLDSASIRSTTSRRHRKLRNYYSRISPTMTSSASSRRRVCSRRATRTTHSRSCRTSTTRPSSPSVSSSRRSSNTSRTTADSHAHSCSKLPPTIPTHGSTKAAYSSKMKSRKKPSKNSSKPCKQKGIRVL